MNEEFEQHEAEENPGSLGDAFGGFAPELPDGSWERLADRRRKRRRFLIWWWLPGLLLVAGFSTWFFMPPLEHGMSSSREEIVHSSSPALTEKSQDKPEEIQRGKEMNSSEEQPQTSVRKPKENLTNREKEDEAVASIQTSDIEKISAENQDAIASGNRNTPEENEAIVTSKPNIKQGSKNPGKSENKLSLFKPKKKNRTSKRKEDVEHSPARSKPKTTHDFKPVDSDKRAQKMDTEEVIKETNLLPPVTALKQSEPVKEEDQAEPDKGFISKPVVESHKSSVLDSMFAKSATAVDSMPKNFPDTSRKETVVLLDSSKQKETIKSRFGFEAGLSGLLVSQQVTLRYPGPERNDVTFKEASRIRAMWGAGLQMRLVIPIYRRWSVLPLIEMGFLSQKVNYVEKAGPQSTVKLVKTNNGFEASPSFTTTYISKERWLFTQMVGAEIGFQATEKLHLRAGMSRTWIRPTNGSTPANIVDPTFMAALQYRVRRHWFLRTEFRRFSIFEFAIPETGSNGSTNFQFGFGLVWKTR